MRIHHLNCGTMCPYSARLVNGKGSLFAPGQMVCHCLLIETNAGLVLVDTGIGLADIAIPSARLGSSFAMMTRPRFDREETALRQVLARGFKAEDVRHIIVTHLDLDHAGGLTDFPNAQVHVFAPEHAAAMARQTFNERHRYRPLQWAHQPHWVLHSLQGERWFGFDSVQALDASYDLLLIPLIGHTRGHCAVAVRTEQKWLLHCGDAYFFHGEIVSQIPYCPLGLSIFQRLIHIDRAVQQENLARLRRLARDHYSEVEVFCAHDLVEWSRYQPAILD